MYSSCTLNLVVLNMHQFAIVYDWPISHFFYIQYMKLLIILHYYTKTNKAAIVYVLLERSQSFYKHNIFVKMYIKLAVYYSKHIS